MSDDTEITDPAALLAAADAGAPHARLDPEVERLVARALAERSWRILTAASRVLRMVQAFAREDRKPVPPRAAELLREVRAAMKGPRERL
jgi:hypothetical protein